MKSFVRFITLLLFVGIVLLAFLFAVRNTTEISLWIGIELPPLSAGVLLILAFILGGLLGLLLGVGVFRQLGYRVRIRKLEMQLNKARHKATEDRAGSASKAS